MGEREAGGEGRDCGGGRMKAGYGRDEKEMDKFKDMLERQTKQNNPISPLLLLSISFLARPLPHLSFLSFISVSPCTSRTNT